MYLSDRDLDWAIRTGQLVVEPPPTFDPASIDLRLDHVDRAQVWDIAEFATDQSANGISEPELRLGSFKYGELAEKHLIPPPEYPGRAGDKVVKRGNEVLVRPGGFLLWTTKEIVGTPQESAQLICFVDGKSTRARTGIVVHLTAPTIHGGWVGNITLEIANFGPFTFVLKEDDVIAQLTVARLTSIPEKTHARAGSATLGQTDVTGRPR